MRGVEKASDQRQSDHANHGKTQQPEKRFAPPVVSTHAENGIRSSDPESEGAATRKPRASGPSPMTFWKRFADGPKERLRRSRRRSPASHSTGLAGVIPRCRSWCSSSACFRSEDSFRRKPIDRWDLWDRCSRSRPYPKRVRNKARRRSPRCLVVGAEVPDVGQATVAVAGATVYPNVCGWKAPPPRYQRSFLVDRRNACNSLRSASFEWGRRLIDP